MGVYLRPITNSDTQNIIKWRNSPHVSDNFIFQKELTKEAHEDWLNNQVMTGKVAQFIIVTDEFGEIGSVYLRDVDKINEKAEFGIFIGETLAFGKGFGSTAASLILDYAFNKLQLNKVYLRVFPSNIAAIKSYERAGFVREGYFLEDVIIDSHPRDLIFMALLASDWRARHG